MEINIYVSYTCSKAKFPGMETYHSIYDHRQFRSWRHLDTMQYKTFIHSRVPRVRNESGEIATIEVPWASRSQRHTYLFEAAIIQTLQACKNQTKTAELCSTSFDIVNGIMHNAVARGLAQRTIRDDIEEIGIDEKSFKRGHHYITVLFDNQQSAVLDVTEGRTKEATAELLETTFTDTQLSNIKVVTMDMWEAYMNTVSERLPQAMIAHDKFHLIKYLSEMIDKVRRKEVKTQDLLKKARWTLLKNEQNLTEKQRLHWEAILNTSLETAKAWRVRESFKDLYNAGVKGTAPLWSLLLKWYRAAINIQNDIVTKTAQTFYRHMPGILNSLKTKATNAVAERLNGKLQELKFVGKGYRRFPNFRTAILFFNGKLNLYPQLFQ